MKIKHTTLASILLAVLTSGAVFADDLPPPTPESNFEYISTIVRTIAENLPTMLDNKADKSYVDEIGRIHDENIQANYDAIVQNGIDSAKIQANVIGLAEELSYKVDIDDLYPTIEQINDDISINTTIALENKVEIDRKADQSYAEENRENILINDENIRNNHRAITEHRAVIESLIPVIDEKADKSEVALKADKTEVAKKADKTYAGKTRLLTEQNRVTIVNNTQRISTNQINITKLSNRVDNNTAEIKNLGRGIKRLDNKLKNGLATQSALNGLFQPYNVGKVNVSAAVGGYQSKTALAVGTGYRFNENVAAKAGVAVATGSKGGVAYNVGVNFEW